MQPYINPLKASTNTCNRCSRQGIANPEVLHRCAECDYDVCMACYRGSQSIKLSQAQALPSRTSQPTALQSSAGHLNRSLTVPVGSCVQTPGLHMATVLTAGTTNG